MTRQLRHLDQADWFHVYNRGADRQDIFSLPGDHELFERLIGEASKATGVEVHAYALMTNHFHLLIHDPNGNLAIFMQILCGRYALAYNGRTGRTGPLFTGRYGCVAITDDRHLLIEARYVERNPLDIVQPIALASYRHASLGAYLGRRLAPDWLQTDFLLPMMTGSDYLTFVVDPQDADRNGPIKLPTVHTATIRELRAASLDLTGIDIANQPGTVRNIALAVALELRLAESARLAELLGISSAGVRMAARRGRVLCDTDDKMARLKQRLSDRLREPRELRLLPTPA